jgi:hypothetical protein
MNNAERIARLLEYADMLDRAEVPDDHMALSLLHSQSADAMRDAATVLTREEPPAEQEPRELKVLVCTRCGCRIDTGLCGYGCESDGEQSVEREAADMEVHVYTLTRIEPIASSRVGSDPAPPTTEPQG